MITPMAARVGDPPPAAAPGGLGVTCRGVVYIYPLEGYDVVALAGVDLDIVPGESVALLGPSGSGKSTLLSVLAGLLRPAAGQVRVGEHDLVRATEAELARMRASDVGVVLQGAGRNLLPYLTAEQNVRFAQRGTPGASDRPTPREVLSLVGFAVRGRLRQRPAALAPGERQRLALAVALANRPGLLLTDEPTSQLDTHARDEVVAALDSVRRSGTTVVVVTHDPDVGVRMGRTVTIRDGRVGAEGRRGEDYSVVGRDGSVHLPPEVLKAVEPGTLLRVRVQPDGSVVLTPAHQPSQVGGVPALASTAAATRPMVVTPSGAVATPPRGDVTPGAAATPPRADVTPGAAVTQPVSLTQAASVTRTAAAAGNAAPAGAGPAGVAAGGGVVPANPGALDAPHTGDGVHSNSIILGTEPAPNGGVER
jgi:putative ABC transport system ATP-binding protein